MQKVYRSFDEFAREELRPMNRVGFSLDELDIDGDYQDDFLFDRGDEEEEEED